MPRVTTYHPPQRQPRQDPSRRRRRRGRAGGARASALADGGEDVAEAYGRKLRPLLATPRLHRQGRRGRQGPDRRHDLLAAAGARRPRATTPGHRRAYAAPPASRRARDQQRRVGRAGAARRLARAGPGGDRGLRPAAATRSRRTSRTAPRTRRSAPATVVVLSAVARQQDAVDGVRGGPAGRRAVRRHPRLGEPARRATCPRRLRRRRRTAAPRSSKGRGAPKVSMKVHDEDAARRARLRRHPRRRPAARPRPPRLVELTYAPAAPSPTSPSSARASPSTPAGSRSSPPAA